LLVAFGLLVWVVMRVERADQPDDRVPAAALEALAPVVDVDDPLERPALRWRQALEHRRPGGLEVLTGGASVRERLADLGSED
jgi:hypothetical protein